MEKLADKGNGNYAYIDTLSEARKVLVEQMAGTLVTIAKDVKIQVEFNPAQVAGYRLIGYENRVLAAEDFNNDKKDAGEIGAGHTCHGALRDRPGRQGLERAGVDPLKYQKPAGLTDSNELLTVKLRYKEPEADTSKLIEVPVEGEGPAFDRASETCAGRRGGGVRDAAARLAVQGRDNYNAVLEIALGVKGNGDAGHRAEFRNLVETARDLAKAKR